MKMDMSKISKVFLENTLKIAKSKFVKAQFKNFLKWLQENPQVIKEAIIYAKEKYDIWRANKASQKGASGQTNTRESTEEDEIIFSTQFYGEKNLVYQEWKFVLEKLFILFHRYNKPPKDAAYWYGERTLNGLLASAAWMVEKAWALEEWTSVRIGKGKQGVGRGDLWMGFGEQKSLTIEAKVVWPEGNEKTAVNQIHRELKRADAQLDQLEEASRLKKRAALCWVVPEFKKSGPYAKRTNYEEFFNTVGEALEKDRLFIACFWYIDKPPVWENKVYPGVMLVSKFSNW
jgi:hypothetical protein